MYDDKTIWHIQIPLTTYIYYALGWGLLLLGLVLAFFFNRFGIPITIVAIVATLVCVFFASNQYKILGDYGIAFSGSSTGEKYEYQWGDVEKVLLAIPTEENDKHMFEFYFTDGNMLEFERDNYFGEFYHKFIEAKNSYGFVYESIKR